MLKEKLNELYEKEEQVREVAEEYIDKYIEVLRYNKEDLRKEIEQLESKREDILRDIQKQLIKEVDRYFTYKEMMEEELNPNELNGLLKFKINGIFDKLCAT